MVDWRIMIVMVPVNPFSFERKHYPGIAAGGISRMCSFWEPMEGVLGCGWDIAPFAKKLGQCCIASTDSLQMTYTHTQHTHRQFQWFDAK